MSIKKLQKMYGSNPKKTFQNPIFSIPNRKECQKFSTPNGKIDNPKCKIVLFDKLNLSVDRKPQLAPGDGPPSPRPWQVAGASGGPPNPRGPNVPTHQDWDAVRDNPELSARLALYDPEEDAQPPSAGAAASTDPVVIVHAEGAADGAPELDREPAAAPEPAEPFLVPEADLVVQEADDLPLGNEEAVQHSPLVN